MPPLQENQNATCSGSMLGRSDDRCFRQLLDLDVGAIPVCDEGRLMDRFPTVIWCFESWRSVAILSNPSERGDGDRLAREGLMYCNGPTPTVAALS